VEVTILGPGLVQRFRGSGILVNNSNRSRVVNVTASTNCMSGVLVGNSSDSHFESIVSVRNGTVTAPCGGLWITGGSNRNRVLRNQISGNGYVQPPGSNFGIGLLNASDNLIEDNVVTGNLTGVRINAPSIGNVFKGNTIAGNPPILVSNNAPDNGAFGFDILNLSAAGANTFENNLCITAMNAPCANLKSATAVIPLVTGVVFGTTRVRLGSSFSATVSGNNLISTTYFDVRVRAPGGTSDQDALNWQQGTSASHIVPANTALGDWTVTGVRAHLDANDHTGPFASVQATVTVFASPFWGASTYENRPEVGRAHLDHRCIVDADLMSTASSPGRTWLTFVV
jgi:parallel beta-helix repeat protein